MVPSLSDVNDDEEFKSLELKIHLDSDSDIEGTHHIEHIDAKSERAHYEVTVGDKEDMPIGDETDMPVLPSVDTLNPALMSCISGMYDLSAVVISVLDVVSDVAITIWFYEHDHMTFFTLSLVVMCIAQVAYTFCFMASFTSDMELKEAIVTFCCILPFAQLVPVFIWLQAFDIGWVNSFLLYFDWEPKHVKPVVPGKADYIKVAIQNKLITHGGFIVEAFVESIAQSILQMVAIITLSEASWISVASITVSILSVASKGFMISYCIDTATFLFCFLCFVADVFNLFTTAAWVPFQPTETDTSYLIYWQAELHADIFTWLLFFKDIVIVCFVVFLFTIMIMEAIYSCTEAVCGECCVQCARDGWWRRCGQCFVACGRCVGRCLNPMNWFGLCNCTMDDFIEFIKNFVSFILYTVVFLLALACLTIPLAIVLEGLRFSLIPFFIYGRASYGKNTGFFKWLFNDFLQGDDYDVKVSMLNRYMAHKTLIWSIHADLVQHLQMAIHNQGEDVSSEEEIMSRLSLGLRRKVFNCENASEIVEDPGNLPNDNERKIEMAPGEAKVSIDGKENDLYNVTPANDSKTETVGTVQPKELEFLNVELAHAVQVLAMQSSELTPDVLLEIGGRTVKQLIAFSNTDSFRLSDSWLYALVPLIITALLYSVVYPFMRFATTPWSQVGLLQRTFTFIYGITILCMLLLLPGVLQFQRMHRHLLFNLNVLFTEEPKKGELFGRNQRVIRRHRKRKRAAPKPEMSPGRLMRMFHVGYRDLKMKKEILSYLDELTPFPTPVSHLISDYIPEFAFREEELARVIATTRGSTKLNYSVNMPAIWKNREPAITDIKLLRRLNADLWQYDIGMILKDNGDEDGEEHGLRADVGIRPRSPSM